jgi:hypothetical protein
MRVAIMGDSFTLDYKNTWIEKVVTELNLTLESCVGFSGQSQYTIYKHFLDVINKNPDVIIICHTDYSRLYHPTEIIHRSFMDTKHSDHLVKNKEVLEAARQYYFHFFDETYANLVYSCLIQKMQEMCKEKNIKLINLLSFNSHPTMKYGLWFTCEGGLVDCSKADFIRTYRKEWQSFKDTRSNHFSPNGHQVLANNIIPHIKTYITTDQEFHISLLFPELFA